MDFLSKFFSSSACFVCMNPNKYDDEVVVKQGEKNGSIYFSIGAIFVLLGWFFIFVIKVVFKSIFLSMVWQKIQLIKIQQVLGYMSTFFISQYGMVRGIDI
eukprot:TRINITY_DN5244_c0_g1_i13.p9 TRINITY_DN5244_c0_g1~~TRINITY_DN5244_c0_g1_i13.p9  ORF type:complete len:101 (-),score=5.56 TRINITY_DN5244_c0_g1_i13:883-1185(-)